MRVLAVVYTYIARWEIALRVARRLFYRGNRAYALLVRVHSRQPLSPMPIRYRFLALPCVVTSPHHGHRPCCYPSFILRAYAASVSLAPRLPRRWNRQLPTCLRTCTCGSLAWPPATRAVPTPFGRPNVYVCRMLRVSLPLLLSRAILPVPKIISFQNFRFTNISKFGIPIPNIICSEMMPRRVSFHANR